MRTGTLLAVDTVDTIAKNCGVKVDFRCQYGILTLYVSGTESDFERFRFKMEGLKPLGLVVLYKRDKWWKRILRNLF